MARHDRERHAKESLAGFYCDGGAEFWRIFAETPRAAVAAFKAKPEVFGALERLYADWPKSRTREHQRISGLLDGLLRAGGRISAASEELGEG